MHLWHFVILFLIQFICVGQSKFPFWKHPSSTHNDVVKYRRMMRGYDSNVLRLASRNDENNDYNVGQINSANKDVRDLDRDKVTMVNKSEKSADNWTVHTCRQKGAVGKSFKDPTSKTHYYKCISRNIAVQMPCAPFTVFDEESGGCQTSDIDTSPCRGCLNGGDCVITERGYECHCGVNYEGKHCEKHIPRCDPNPCQNGGRCYEISTEPGYICECPNKIFDTCCCHGIENKCAHVPRRFYADKGRMFIHCSRDGYAFVKFCPLGLVFNDLRQTCTPRPQYHSEGFKSIQNEDFYKQTENEEYYDKARASDQQPPYIFNQSAPHAFY